MEEKIKVLILEDLPSDAELAEREVKAVLTNYKTMVTNREQGFLKALENFKPDLIISDYMLPAFDGMKALQIIRKKEEFIPFIILTGSMNEETAVECMKAGADDYVIKEHIKRLGPSIINALDKKKIRQERKQAEKALKESEEKYRKIFENVQDIFYQVDNEGNIIDISPSIKRYSGYSSEELIGTPVTRVYNNPNERALLKAELEKKGEVVDYELRLKSKSERLIYVSLNAHILYDENKKPAGVEGSLRDITERKRNEQIQSIIHNISNAGVTSHSPENFLTFVKDELGKLIDTTNFFVALYDEETDHISLPFHHDEKDKAETFSAGKTLTNYVIKSGKPLLATKTIIAKLKKSGEVKTIGHPSEVWLGVPLKSENKITGIFAVQSYDNENAYDEADVQMLEIISDQISLSLERLRAEQELKIALKKVQQSEAKYRRIFEESQDVIFVSNSAGQILDINPAGIKLFGYASLEEMQSINISQELYKNSLDREPYLQEINKNGFVRDYELDLKKKDGSDIIVLVTSKAIYDNKHKIIGYRGTMRDVTEKKRLEAQLFQSQKMEVVGQLAGGVAHDFNNLLTVINGYTDILLMTDIPQKIKDPIEQIGQAGKRAGRLTAQLLAFSRKQIIQPELLNFNTLVSGHIKMLGRLLGEHIEIATLLYPEPAYIKADPGQMEQIIMNITINARDAMPMGGKLAIETNIVEFDVDYQKTHAGAQPGKYVMLAISDTGIGMDKATMGRIFEPFFTTKGRDKGTGLGLATVYGIVKQNNGFIYVYSEPNQGTTFKIYFPAVEAEIQKEGVVSEDKSQLRGTETILLVEDELSVRELTHSILSDYGYHVLTAANGEEAVRIFHEQRDQIDLLFTDVIMPLMGGRELAEKLSAENPQIKIIYCSGYTDNSIVHHGVLDEGAAFIQKPYSHIDLVKKVRRILDGV